MASGNTSQVNQATRSKKSWLRPLVWAVIIFFWISIIIPVVGSIVSNAIVLPDAWKQAMTKFSGWLFANPPLLIACFFILILCTVIAFLLTRERTDQEVAPSTPAPVHVQITLPEPAPSIQVVPPVPTGVREKYLRIMLQKTLSLNLQGIPTPYRLPNVLLEEVFIPLKFLPRRLDSDYEITKEEGQHYLELEQKGMVPEDMERVFIDREHRLLDRLTGEKRIGINELWQCLDRKHATVVIQGQPGMGKSTLLARLTLHFARLNLGETDALIAQSSGANESVPIPILFILKDYATEYKKAHDSARSLSVLDYLLQTTKSIDISELFVFLKASLTEGRCLVLFDGLDEISGLDMRRLIRGEIEHFIAEYSAIPSGLTFNRFLITSRVAGYEVVVFQHYQHVTVAALTEEQIRDFLPRWCRASLSAPEMVGPDKHKALLLQEADLTAQHVMDAVTTSPGARKLADNPLLLTLLVVLQLNRVELPRQRWKLYSAITTMMLENRNSDKFLPVVDEKQAIKRLGPIAYDMQARNNNFASKRFVSTKLSEIIAGEDSEADAIEIDAEAATFLWRIRERSGLFVIRTGDYYGFFHRTFQEYIAARYILDQIKRDPATWITTFVEHARRTDDLWREPFLLAIAYQSDEDEAIAQEIITALLDRPLQDTVQQTHDILLVAECLLEAKPLGRTLETRIYERLLEAYEQALRMYEDQVCQRIERVVTRLLLNLSQEAFRPAFLDVLYKKICGIQQIALQRATLTLLTMIAQALREGPELIFAKLIPPLLSLAGLPGVGKKYPDSKGYDLDPEVVCTSNFAIADLALGALSFMDKRGPAGIVLVEIRRYFKDEHPTQLRQLAHFSLQSRTLITPAVIPLAEENYRQYETAVGQWLALKKRSDAKLITEDDIDACVLIHEALLACAEEAAYPATMHIQHMVQASENDPANWRSIWQDYLLNQLNSGHYVSYQECALLWATLFTSEQEQKNLATSVMKHINNNSNIAQAYGLHFISSLAKDLSYFRDFRGYRGLRDLSNLRYLRYLNYLSILSKLGHVRHLGKLSNLGFMTNLGKMSELNKLNIYFFIKNITIKSLALLVGSEEISHEGKCIDLLTILMGRLLYIIETHQMGKDIEQEIRQIVQATPRFLAPTNTEDVIDAALDILRSLPVRTANEITFVLQQEESAMDQDVKAAYIRALRYAEPHDKAAWDALMKGKSSHVQDIQEVVEEVLKNKG